MDVTTARHVDRLASDIIYLTKVDKTLANIGGGLFAPQVRIHTDEAVKHFRLIDLPGFR